MESKTIHTKTAGGVVFNNKKQVLVVFQKSNSTWSLPKGHLDEGEDEITAARREIFEETNIENLQLIKKLGQYERYNMKPGGSDDITEFKTITMFLFKTNSTSKAKGEIGSTKWVEKEKVADLLTHPKDKEFYLSIKENF